MVTDDFRVPDTGGTRALSDQITARVESAGQAKVRQVLNVENLGALYRSRV